MNRQFMEIEYSSLMDDTYNSRGNWKFVVDLDWKINVLIPCL